MIGWGWEYPVGLLEIIGGGFGLFVFVTEAERWPLQWLRWSIYVAARTDRYDGNAVIVGIRRKNQKATIAKLDPQDADFDTKLAEAESLAVERCIQLNTTEKSRKRRL